MVWYQNQDCFLPSLHLAKDFLIWQIMVLQTKQTCWKGVQECHRRFERSWLIDLSSNSSNAFSNPQNMICLIWSAPSQETSRFAFSFNFSFYYVLQQNADTWSLSCAGLTDKEPVQGWMCHTSNFLRGLDSSEWESQNVHSPGLGLTGKLYHSHWLCPPQLKAVLELMIFFHWAQQPSPTDLLGQSCWNTTQVLLQVW